MAPTMFRLGPRFTQVVQHRNAGCLSPRPEVRPQSHVHALSFPSLNPTTTRPRSIPTTSNDRIYCKVGAERPLDAAPDSRSGCSLFAVVATATGVTPPPPLLALP
jgi:hypothetical protein